MTYFIWLKKLYLFLRQNELLCCKDSKCSGKTWNICSGNGSQLPGSSRNSECHFKTK